MMIPHERSLVKKFEGQPFALIGVNTDSNRDEVKQKSKQNEVTWRSFWTGNPGGPISRQWGVSGYPTIFVIDHQGVIRAITHSSQEMENTVEKLLKDMANQKTQQ